MRQIRSFYDRVRKHSEVLCSPLRPEDYVPQIVEFASPPKWHLAHTTWFFEQMILQNYVKGYTVFDEQFSFLFNSYYNNVGSRILRSERGNLTRPTTDEVYAYRNHVDGHMENLLNSLDTRTDSKEIVDLTILGLNHEQQHQELFLSDLKYSFGHNPTFPVYKEDFDVHKQAENIRWIEVKEGLYSIGHQSDEFCYDNELGAHKFYLNKFEVSSELVTNGEYLEFIDAGGYQQFEHWLDEGWTWVNQNSVDSPLYWHKVDGKWMYYELSGLKPIDMEAPLKHVSFYEAMAYAAWKGLRLPTEQEWEVASEQFDWGQRWEWTNSAYLPYPGYQIAEGAVGEYNGKFMVNQMVLRGGSVATSEGHSRNTYRNFFHPQHQWQFTGIRLAK